jgi:hypothetical protein
VRRTHVAVAAFAVGLAVAFGASALRHTVQLATDARRQSARDVERSIAARKLALDRQQAALRAALRRHPPALPPLPKVPKAASHPVQPLPLAAPAAPAPAVTLTRQAPVAHTHSSPAKHGGEGDDGGGDD